MAGTVLSDRGVLRAPEGYPELKAVNMSAAGPIALWGAPERPDLNRRVDVGTYSLPVPRS